MSSAAAKSSDDKPKPSGETPQKSTALILFATAADTTWRMFVPTLGGTLIGLWADGTWHISPWGGIGGLMIGIVITALLVRQQFQKVNTDVK